MDEVDTLMIEVRAGTDGFTRDIEQMRSSIDGNLVKGFSNAGNVLERGLSSAIRTGSLGFGDLKRAAFDALDQIASQSLQTLTSSLTGNSSSSGSDLSGLSGLVGSLLGLPGRATGGNVSPGRAYRVGENGPEVFVPTSAGRIDNGGSSSGTRDVRVAINLNSERGASVPQSLQRSSRQVASAVRRALVNG